MDDAETRYGRLNCGDLLVRQPKSKGPDPKQWESTVDPTYPDSAAWSLWELERNFPIAVKKPAFE